MGDSEEHYPFHQSARDEKKPQRHLFDDPVEGLEEPGKEKAPRHGGRLLHQREAATTPALPHGRFVRTLIIGVIAGVLAAAQAIIITFINSATYEQLSKTPANQAGSLALTLAGLACLTFVISILICVLAGFITGKVAVDRRLGFLSGFITGIIYYAVAVFLVRYIPSYPGNIASSGATSAAGVTGGLVVSLIFLIVLGVIGGLFSLLGAWLATRRNPYYVGYAG